MSEDQLTQEQQDMILEFCHYVHEVEQKLSTTDKNKEMVISICVNRLLEYDREAATKVMITNAVKPFCEAAESLAAAEILTDDGMWN